MKSQLVRRRLELEDIGEVTVASFTDRKLLDEQSLQDISEQLVCLVDELGRKKLLLNFGNIQDISSLALGMLLRLNKKIQAVGGKLVLCRLDPKIHEVIAITNLDKLFVIRGDEQEALAAF
jgi:anti-sigma B factor antagonist